MDEDLVEFDATCHVDGCWNKDITIRVLASATGPNIVCGAHVNSEGMNEPITDVVRAPTL